jgi:hypothetical protein
MTNYARRIEHDLTTIDLNNTAVGFGHGADTFGWRFYPRFQTPDIESNGTVIFRDLLWGGPSRDALLRQRRLEPGQRECVAIVMMPSFVPFATLEVSSDWFCLTNPKCKSPNLPHVMKLSKRVKAITDCGPQVTDAHCYRDGDMQRLLERGKQLEARLPLQTLSVQIPYENTLGGFAMFNAGITDLAPELTGWYGAAEVNLDRPTTVFFVGDHFSVHQTRVIAGGEEVQARELLSRQVMKAVIPGGVKTLKTEQGNFVDVHLATPYGVTSHLLIPACGSEPKGFAWKVAGVQIPFQYGDNGKIKPLDPAFNNYPAVELELEKEVVSLLADSNAKLKLSFAVPFADKVVPVTLADLPLKDRKIKIPGPVFAKALFDSFGDYFDNKDLSKQVEPVSIWPTEVFIGGTTLQAVNQLTIFWLETAPPKDKKNG